VISDDPFDQGSRERPLYPGAVGQLLFTVQEEPAAGQLAGETLWSVQLGTGAVTRGPLLLPVGTDSGFPAAPGLPPNRAFALGPAGTPGAGTLAFLADAPRGGLGGRRFVFGLDVGSRLDLPPAPISEGVAFAFGEHGELYVLRAEANGTFAVQIVNGPERARVGPLRESVLSLAATGGRLFLVQSTTAYGVFPPFERILELDGGSAQTVLEDFRVLGVGLNARFLVAPAGAFGRVLLFEPGREPQPLPGFLPVRIVGWTRDRQHYAAVGTFRGEYGLWFTQWPNTPVFRMMPMDVGDSIDVVAFDEQARVAFFVHELDIWAVEIGSERAFKLPLPDEAARELPSGPLVWIP
jgi:hypothetical protein